MKAILAVFLLSLMSVSAFAFEGTFNCQPNPATPDYTLGGILTLAYDKTGFMDIEDRSTTPPISVTRVNLEYSETKRDGASEYISFKLIKDTYLVGQLNVSTSQRWPAGIPVSMEFYGVRSQLYCAEVN